MRELTTAICRPRAPLPESPRCDELDADMTRMTPMAAAARCSPSFARCRNRDRNAGARPIAMSHEMVTKKHNAAVNTEKPQTARTKNDPKSFFFCPYNVRR
jgi:hypothetical protein